jgi:hypothetical protein
MATVETSIPRRVQPTRATFFTFLIYRRVRQRWGAESGDLAQSEGLWQLGMLLPELLI